MAVPPAVASLKQQAATWWHGRTPRERRAVTLVLVVLALFLVWTLAVQPAWRTVRAAPAQLDRLDAELQQMQRIAAESRQLRDVAPVSVAQAGAALKAAADRLGATARLVLQGERASLTLSGVSPEALRAFLIEARSGARARPLEAQLQRGPQGYGGTMSFSLGGGA
jgi:general secretion pathway protein M